MSKMVMVFWTTGSIDEARKVCRYLVQEELVACCNLIPWVESIYSYQGELHTEQESKVIMKTLKEHFETIVDIIKKHTSYELPEINMVEVDESFADYKDYVTKQVKGETLKP